MLRTITEQLTEKPFDTGEVTINYAEGERNGPPAVFLHGTQGKWQDVGGLVSIGRSAPQRWPSSTASRRRFTCYHCGCLKTRERWLV